MYNIAESKYRSIPTNFDRGYTRAARYEYQSRSFLPPESMIGLRGTNYHYTFAQYTNFRTFT